MLRKRGLISMLFILCCFFTLTACSGDTNNNKDKETTSATENTTSAPETTTTEPETTTEEPTTEYVYKGQKIRISNKRAEYFKELVVEKGYKFVLNEIIPLSEGESGDRGNCAADIIDALYTEHYPEKVEEFWNKYMKPGDPRLLIEYEDNVVIEYTGDKKMIFHFVEEDDISLCRRR
ncbi:MAG: hypothetical protein E7270_11050 [Lachnospiraceae bacterium]|nr:hypothetical protein [Lachnospiraceae bacterium]